MTGLTVVVTRADPGALRSAATLAAAAAALGGRARVYLHEDAAALLAAPLPTDAADPAKVAGGLPSLADAVATARTMGVAFVACQAGLALAGVTTLPPGWSGGGLVGLLADLDEDRLVTL